MTSRSTYQQVTTSTVAKSTVNTSATQSIGSRAKSFAARLRGDGTTLSGGDIAAVVTLSSASHTLGSTLGTFQITVTVQNAEGDNLTDAPVWSSDAPTKATVSQTGLVTGVATGSANITVTAGGVTSSACAITVP